MCIAITYSYAVLSFLTWVSQLSESPTVKRGSLEHRIRVTLRGIIYVRVVEKVLNS
jgi:hypothetical protein